MRFGVTIFCTDVSIQPTDLAAALQERGFDSMWVPEHTHIPVSRRTPYPNGGELPEEYKRCHDPFVALTAAAVAAPGLRVGTGIALVAQREPIVTAKAVASVDQISGGRFTLGIGFGWNEDEMEDHGVDYRGRRELAREHVLAMRRLWEDEEATFDGEFVQLPPSWSWPKPVQQPLPVLIGGAAGPKLFNHIAEYAQGWIPIGGRGLGETVPELRARVEEAGRDSSGLEIVPVAVVPDHGKLDHYQEVGVTECVFGLPSAGRDDVLSLLDKYAALLAEHAS
ncbi:MAG TPA: LLM class F420-dependent oxidoreductase [Acidimicrobiales bacterium]|jgi:probable F420-dependent oxidoreductase|nr:LLM class F420-dependent oxidoreductase [Acidimicrobiales bacterium]